MKLTLTGGPEPICLEVNPAKATLLLPGKLKPGEGGVDPVFALQNPVDYPNVEQCLTPGDTVAVALEGEGLDRDSEVGALLERIQAGGLGEGQVTLILGSGATVESESRLREKYPGIKVVRHDPKEPGNSCYLATLKMGKRIYLNREFLESDFQIFVGATKKGSEGKLAGPQSAILAGLDVPAKEGDSLTQSELREVFGFMGNSYLLVRVDSGSGGKFASDANWWAGAKSAIQKAKLAHREVWRGESKGPADLVLVGTGVERSNDFPFWCRAIKKAGELVSEQGVIVLVPGQNPDLSPWERILERAGEPGDLLEYLRRLPKNLQCIRWWAYAAEKASILLPSYLPDKTFELLFANPVRVEEIQALVEKATKVAVIGDYSKAVAKVPE